VGEIEYSINNGEISFSEKNDTPKTFFETWFATISTFIKIKKSESKEFKKDFEKYASSLEEIEINELEYMNKINAAIYELSIKYGLC